MSKVPKHENKSVQRHEQSESHVGQHASSTDAAGQAPVQRHEQSESHVGQHASSTDAAGPPVSFDYDKFGICCNTAERPSFRNIIPRLLICAADKKARCSKLRG